jgi:hypothetical protein
MLDNEAFDDAINISVLQMIWRVLKQEGTLYLLHVPKSDYQDWSLWELAKFRVDYSGSVGLSETLLVVAKALPEWLGEGRNWTVGEDGAMIRDAGFEFVSVQAEPVIIIEARKRH